MRKRWIIGGVLIAALVAGYAVYWHQVANILEQNLTLWPEQWRAKGYQVDIERSEVTGFPWLVRSRVHNLAVRSPPGPNSWHASKQFGTVFLTAKPWQPFGFDIELEREQSWTIADGTDRDLLRLSSNWGGAHLGVTYGGQLNRVAFHSLQTVILGGNLPRIQIGTAGGVLTLGEDSSPPDRAADINIMLSLDDVLIDLPPDSPLGNHLTRLVAGGFVTGQIPPGPPREALTQWRDAGGVAEITKLVVNWGPLAVTADATIALDRELQPLVAGTAIVRGYNETVDAMVASGLVSPGQGATTKIALAALAETDDGGSKVRLPITIQDGFLFLGPLKVVAVPRIDWEMQGRTPT